MISLKSQAHIKKASLSSKDLLDIKKTFTIPNPLFFKLESMGKPTWATPKKLEYYTETPTELIIPLGGAQNLTNMGLQVIDERFENKTPINIKFTGTLRGYQEEASKAIMGKTIGTLQATTGSGKTIIAIHAICERKQPTLFLVHTLDLANQFIERVAQFTDYKKESVGFIGNGKYNVKPITVATLQTIVKLSDKKIEEINNYFGQVFVDEVHK
jgi:type I site-specific restriction endonuclease